MCPRQQLFARRLDTPHPPPLSRGWSLGFRVQGPGIRVWGVAPPPAPRCEYHMAHGPAVSCAHGPARVVRVSPLTCACTTSVPREISRRLLARTHTLSLLRARARSLFFPLSLARLHTLSRTLSLSLSLSRARALSLSRTDTLSLSHSHTLCLALARARSLPLSHSCSLSQSLSAEGRSGPFREMRRGLLLPRACRARSGNSPDRDGRTGPP